MSGQSRTKPTQENPTPESPALSPPVSGRTVVAQKAGNGVAVDKAGLAGGGGFGGDLGEISTWMGGQVMDMLGLETGETEYPFELAQQTASNTAAAAKRLQEAAVLAQEMGDTDLAKHLGAAGARLGKVDGLATDLTSIVKFKKDLDLVSRFASATSAMVAVDMRSPEAAATFDAFFAVAGEMGVEISKFGGMWGPILAPYADFLSKLGKSGFFAKMKRNMDYRGNHGDAKNALDAAEFDI